MNNIAYTKVTFDAPKKAAADNAVRPAASLYSKSALKRSNTYWKSVDCNAEQDQYKPVQIPLHHIWLLRLTGRAWPPQR